MLKPNYSQDRVSILPTTEGTQDTMASKNTSLIVPNRYRHTLHEMIRRLKGEDPGEEPLPKTVYTSSSFCKGAMVADDGKLYHKTRHFKPIQARRTQLAC